MKYCYECGHPLEVKKLTHEGFVPYCSACQVSRFPIFHTAVSMIVLNPLETKILMIQQYGKSNNILVAGYVNKGECGEAAIAREMKEEIGRDILKYRFLKSEYFPKSNTLIWNFAVVLDSEDLSDISDWEVDQANWFTFTEAQISVKQDSLAQRFLLNFLAEYEQKTGDYFG